MLHGRGKQPSLKINITGKQHAIFPSRSESVAHFGNVYLAASQSKTLQLPIKLVLN